MYEHFFTRPLTTLTLILTVLSYLLHDFASQCLLDKSRILISLDPKSLRCIILGHFVLYAFGVMYAQLYSLSLNCLVLLLSSLVMVNLINKSPKTISDSHSRFFVANVSILVCLFDFSFLQLLKYLLHKPCL